MFSIVHLGRRKLNVQEDQLAFFVCITAFADGRAVDNIEDSTRFASVGDA